MASAKKCTLFSRFFLKLENGCVLVNGVGGGGKAERVNGWVDGRDCSSELVREWDGRKAVKIKTDMRRRVNKLARPTASRSQSLL